MVVRQLLSSSANEVWACAAVTWVCVKWVYSVLIKLQIHACACPSCRICIDLLRRTLRQGRFLKGLETRTLLWSLVNMVSPILSFALLFIVLRSDHSPNRLLWRAGLSRSILEAGYGVDCLMAQFQGLDLRISENWPGPTGLKWAATHNQVCVMMM